MIARLLRLVEYCSETWRIVLLGVAFLAFQILILPSLQADIMAVSQGTGVLDLLAWYTPDEALQRLNIYGPEGRSIYLRAEWTADFLFPPTYGLLFGAFLFRLDGGTWSLLAIFSWLIDWMENIFITLLLTLYPTFYAGIAQVATLLTCAKWLMILSTIMMLVVRLGALAVRKFGRAGSRTEVKI